MIKWVEGSAIDPQFVNFVQQSLLICCIFGCGEVNSKVAQNYLWSSIDKLVPVLDPKAMVWLFSAGCCIMVSVE